MSWHVQYKPAVQIGLCFCAVGLVLTFTGEMGWLFALPFHAVGLGSILAGYTKVGP